MRNRGEEMHLWSPGEKWIGIKGTSAGIVYYRDYTISDAVTFGETVLVNPSTTSVRDDR